METVEYEGRRIPATYLGDAVYCLYDGFNYWLRLNDHRSEECQICLEPSVIENLINFIKQCSKLREKDERKESSNLA